MFVTWRYHYDDLHCFGRASSASSQSSAPHAGQQVYQTLLRQRYAGHIAYGSTPVGVQAVFPDNSVDLVGSARYRVFFLLGGLAL